MKILFYTLTIFTFSLSSSLAQISVTTTANTSDLINRLIDTGITISGSPSKFCNSNGTGYFTNGHNTSCPLDSGIILCTGYASFLNRDYSFTASAGLNFGMNDPQLMTLSPYSNEDICYIQFNFIPQNDSLVFSYVFGSEEYLEWVNSPFNDVFGFFITGPNPIGGNYSNFNLATVPGTHDIVSINSINPNANPQYYLNNFEGNWNSIFYPGYKDPNFTLDGFTQKMDIGLKVNAGSNYSIKMVIGDVSDPLWDSYVLLSSKSFKSIPSSLLPIHLKTFTGILNSKKEVELYWQTESEINSNIFEIEHSMDALEWSVIGNISASGNSTNVNNYFFTHYEPQSGTNYYRLKGIDENSFSQFSNIITILNNSSEENTYFSPNPIIDKFSFKGLSAGVIKFYNLSSELVYESAISEEKNEIDLSFLTPGIYLINYTEKNGSRHFHRIHKQ